MARDDAVLAFAVSAGQLAYMMLEAGQPTRWHLWRIVGGDAPLARHRARVVIAETAPDLVVIEDPFNGCLKRGQSYAILLSLAQAVEDEPVRSARIRRTSPYANRYEEAQALCDRFPLLSPWRPEKPFFYEPEPRALLIFDALALAVAVVDAPESLAP